MKANELMIGDWFKADDNQEYKVSSIHINNKGCAVRLDCEDYIVETWSDKIEPIPLTEEILRANGWNKNGAYNDYILRRDIDDFIGYNANDKHVRISIDGWNAKQDVYVSVNFVHELQHALRLFGLNELADNFIVI